MSHSKSPDQLIGSIIAHRFAIEEIAGEGGMGIVFRAHDQTSDRKVALKVLSQSAMATTLTDPTRFFREAQVLAELRHPGIVSYVAHGQTPEGQLYLAMEWLSGEDLGKRLQRGTLSLEETLQLARHVADALSAAHRISIVHRDLKPSNLFLRDHRVDQVTLFDFGIAQRGRGEQSVTRTGLVIGTPEYMAPEQARGERTISPASDVFALACIIYACLTGRPPFDGEHVAALLTKILFEEPPPLRSLYPAAPAPLESLLLRMLDKDARSRPPDASAVLPLLAEIADALAQDQTAAGTAIAPRRNLTIGEQQLYSVILAAPSPDDAEATAEAVEWPTEADLATLRRELESPKTSIELLADGSIVSAVSPNANATDQVRDAARLALLLWSRWPMMDIVLATGRGVRGQTLGRPVGEALDRAGHHLRQRQQAPRPRAPGILLDSVSAALLDRSFEVHPGSLGPLLVGTREDADDAPMLLGKPSPCLGREQELGVLDALLSGCLDESQSQAVLLLAPSGYGKTRLLKEFQRRLKSRDVEALAGRGDPLLAAAPYGLLVQMVRRWAGLASTASLPAQTAQLGQKLAILASLDPMLPTQLALACGLHSPESSSDGISHDPARTFTSWLQALCETSPVALLIDDLQWTDASSLRVIEGALRSLSELPLFVLGLGRPEVEKLFPKLWAGKAQDIRLAGLGKRACERLVAHALGKDVPAATVARIVSLSQGNALVLEELIRSVAEGKGDALPDSVLTMMQARLLQLEPGARRVLRVASIFGATFFRGGIVALLGKTPDLNENAIDRWLRLLQEGEVIAQNHDSRLPGDVEYSFRSPALREAAYSLLTDDDRQLGHGLAGVFLEQAGEQDTAVLTSHTLKLVQYLEQRRSSLAVSRLMMLTGIPLRKMLAQAPDDPKMLRRLRAGLKTLLREDELKDIHHLFLDR